MAVWAFTSKRREAFRSKSPVPRFWESHWTLTFNLNSEFEESSSSSRIPSGFAIRLTEQISSIGLFAESQCTEDEHDDEDEDDSKFRKFVFNRPMKVYR
jgi:hypothetical protein